MELLIASAGGGSVRGSRLRASILALALALALAGPRAVQADAQAEEYRVKAAFLYKFGAYVEWPERSFASRESPLAIGVIGADALADELAQIVAGRNVNGRAVLVRRLHPGDSLRGVQVLFVGRVGNERLTEILAATRDKAVLTVTESEKGLELGSTINFVIVDNRVRFDVAPPQADSRSLRISARLLAVARKVVSKPS